MIELIIKAESAQEISVEVQELANQLTGTHKCECKHETVEQPKAEPVSPAAEAFTQPPTAPVEQPVVQSAALPTTSAPQFTREELMTAAAPLMDAGKLEELSALTKQLGVESLTDLPESKFNDFATGIRNLGARI